MGYVIAAPDVEEGDTDFYILGLGGKAENYPQEVLVGRETILWKLDEEGRWRRFYLGGEEVRVIAGVVNREHETASYRIEVIMNGVRNNEVGPLVLENGEKWEEVVSFTPDRLGDNQKVEFFLYQNGQSEVYHSLHLWVNVKEKR